MPVSKHPDKKETLVERLRDFGWGRGLGFVFDEMVGKLAGDKEQKMKQDNRRAEEVKLLASMARELPRLEELWQEMSSHRGYEDPIYRFYHQSFKVFHLQEQTARIVETLQSLAPHRPLAPWFKQIVAEGAAGEFTPAVNARWSEATRPIVEAFFHARYFLEMVCKYGRELKEPPEILPSGWAAVLCLYGLR